MSGVTTVGMETTTKKLAAAAAEQAKLPVYKSGEVPEPLLTMTQLKERRLEPAEGQEVLGFLRMYRRGHGWGKFPLYDPAAAQPMRPLSAKQESAYWGDNAWQPLHGGDHRALGDCRAVIGVLREVAAPVEESGESDPWEVRAEPIA